MQRNLIIVLSVAVVLLLGYVIFDALADFKAEIERELESQRAVAQSTEVQALAGSLEELKASVIALSRPVQIPPNATGEYLIEAGVRNNQLELARLSARLDEMRAGLILEVSTTRRELAELTEALPGLARQVEWASGELARQAGALPSATRVANLESRLLELDYDLSAALEKALIAQASLEARLGALAGEPALASPEALVQAALAPLEQRLSALDGLAQKTSQLEEQAARLAGGGEGLESRLNEAAEARKELEERVAAAELLLSTHEARLAGVESLASALAPLTSMPLPQLAERWHEFAEEEGGDARALQLWLSPPLQKPTPAMIEEALQKSPYVPGSFMNQLRKHLLTQRADPETVDAGMAEFARALLEAARTTLASSTATLERLHAAGQLPTLGDRAASPVLSKLLADESPVIRGQAALGVGMLGDDSLAKHLIALAESDDEPFVRSCAIMALGELGSREAIPALRDLTRDRRSSREVRARALESLRLLEESADRRP